MANIYTSAEQLIGNTPLLELTGLEKELNLKARLLAKLEFFNPAGSVKDRVAKAMLDDAAAQGKITKDTVIIEPTSGNTGIGLASVAAARGLRVIIVMPETMSIERRLLMKPTARSWYFPTALRAWPEPSKRQRSWRLRSPEASLPASLRIQLTQRLTSPRQALKSTAIRTEK